MALQQSGFTLDGATAKGFEGGLGGGPKATITSQPGGNQWKQFFGEPPRPVALNPYDGLRRENMQLPEAYHGSNGYMTSVIISLITEADLWPCKFVLPFKLADSSLEIVWDELIFNNHLLGPVPEEGVSRLVTQQSSERRDHFVRYGLAFQLEHGFMKTEKGRKSYELNLMQIRNACLETAYIGVLEALLQSKTYAQMWGARFGKKLTAVSSKKMRDLEVAQWAAVQKMEHGFDIIDSDAKRALRSIGVAPDTWIVPEGLPRYLALRPENSAFFYKGPTGNQFYLEGMDAHATMRPDIKDLKISNDCAVFVSRSFDLPGQDEPVDVLKRVQTIGEYVLMQPNFNGNELREGYNSEWRSIVVYDEDRDGWAKIGLEDAIDNCARFSGFDADGSVKADFTTPDRNKNDMLVTKNDNGDYKWVDIFGDMNEKALPNGAIADWAHSVLGAIDYDGNLADDIREGLKMVRDIEKNPDMKFLSAMKLQEIENGFYKIPTVGDVGTKPTGCTSWPGLIAITERDDARKRYDPQGILTRLVRAVKAIYSRLESVSYLNVLIDEQYTPEYLHKKDGCATFFATCVHKNQKPLYLKEKLGGVTMFETPLSPDEFKEFAQGIWEDAANGANKNTVDTDSMATMLQHLLSSKSRKGNQTYKDLKKGSVDILDISAEEKGLIDDTVQRICQALKKVMCPNDQFMRIVKQLAEIRFPTTGPTNPAKLYKALRDLADKAQNPPTFASAMKVLTDGNGSIDKIKDVVEQDFKGEGNIQRSQLVGDIPDMITSNQARVGSRIADASREIEESDVPYFRPSAGGSGGVEAQTGFSVAKQTPTFKARWADVEKSTASDDMRCVSLALLGAKMCRRTLMQWVKTDCVVPLGFLLVRPQMQYTMASAILLKAGLDTGATYLGHADFQLADNVIQKMHTGNFTLYLKSVVTASRNVFIAPNVMSCGYNGGGNVKFMKTREEYMACLRGQSNASVIAMMIPYACNCFLPNPIDITGKMTSENIDVSSGAINMEDMYHSAGYYRSFYGFDNTSYARSGDTPYYYAKQRPNTMVYQGHFASYSPVTKSHSMISMNTGHWSERVYPGCGKVRAGLGTILREVDYSSAYGSSRGPLQLGY